MMSREMTNKECIHDLKAIREDFEKRCGFCTPVCLDKAINIIENLEHIQAELDRAKSLLERKPAKWQESVFRHRTPSTCTTIHGFECSECHAFSHLKSKYCSDCGSFMENWI